MNDHEKWSRRHSPIERHGIDRGFYDSCLVLLKGNPDPEGVEL